MAQPARKRPDLGLHERSPSTRVVSLAGVRIDDPDLLVDFTLERGAVAVILGPPGSGKSRLMAMIASLETPPSGHAALLGRRVADLLPKERPALRRRMGIITQPPRFLEHLTAAQNVSLPLNFDGQLARDYSRDVDELLAFVGLSSADERPMARLSETARRRAAVARAMVNRPDLILADEPFAGLGPEACARLAKALLGMRQVGAAILVTTQQPEVASLFAAPVWRIDAGRLRQPESLA